MTPPQLTEQQAKTRETSKGIERYPSVTKKLKVVTSSDNFNIYLTVAYEWRDGRMKIRYILINSSAAPYAEWHTAISILITKLVMLDVPMKEIMDDLAQIASAHTAHMPPGSSELCLSLVARIAKELIAIDDLPPPEDAPIVDDREPTGLDDLVEDAAAEVAEAGARVTVENVIFDEHMGEGRAFDPAD